MAATRYDREAAAARREQTASGLRGDFATQAAANPYVGREFSPTYWQDIGERYFGDYSARDAFYAEQDQAADEYLAQLVDAQRQQDYNDPASKVARERAAGQNPDLVGTEGTAEASPVAPDDTPPSVNTGVGAGDVLQSVATSAATSFLASLTPLNLVSDGVSFMQALEDLNGSRIRNDYADIAGAMNMYPQLVDYIGGTSESPSISEVGDTDLSAGTGTITPSFSTQMASLGMSKRAARRLGKMFHVLTDGSDAPSVKTRRQQIKTAGLKAGEDAVKIMNTPGYADDIMQWAVNYQESYGNLLNACNKAQLEMNMSIYEYDLKLHSPDMAEADFDAQMATFEATENQSDFFKDYYKNLSPEQVASAENDSARTQFVMNAASRRDATVSSAINKFFADEIDNISKSDMSDAAKYTATLTVLEKRNEWLRSQSQLDAAAVAKGQKTIGQSDWLNLGGDVVKTGVNLMTRSPAGKTPTYKSFEPYSPSYTY